MSKSGYGLFTKEYGKQFLVRGWANTATLLRKYRDSGVITLI